MRYIREIVIVVLVLVLCFATYQCDRNKGKLTAREAGDARQVQISSVQAPRTAVREREALYADVDKANESITSQRAKIVAAERETKPAPSRKEVTSHVESKTKGDIGALAGLFKFAGYSCTVR